MTDTNLTALAAFALATSITPGPNNLMLLASGAHFGVRATLPHVFGIVAGFALLLIFAGLGLVQMLAAHPWLNTALKMVMAGWLLMLVWQMARAGSPAMGNDDEQLARRPMSFAQAMLFQWVNPKGWAMVLGVLALHVPPDSGMAAVMRVAAIYAAIMLPSVMCWLLLGRQMQRLLRTPRRRQVFNITMAMLLLVSLYPAQAP